MISWSSGVKINCHSPWLRTVQLGIRSLYLHKMRSALTMLGIIFGVCSVIAMLAIGEGASYEAQQAI
jgi:putative ABC transport system permease protein